MRLVFGLLLFFISATAVNVAALENGKYAAGQPPVPAIKIAWGITGCGHRLKESIEVMKELRKEYNLEVKVFLSQAGETAVKWYGFYDELKTDFTAPSVEKSANIPFLAGALQLGRYDFLLIMPSTSNTAAKIASGISDSLLTNAAAQAMKAKVPVYIFPADQKKGDFITDLPGGKKLTLTVRDVDVEAVDKLRKMPGITVMENPGELRAVIKNRLAAGK